MADKPDTKFVPENPMVCWILEEDAGSFRQLRKALELPENREAVFWRDPQNGWTLLHYACYAKNFRAVELLVRLRARINVFTKDGKSPFSLAALRADERHMKPRKARRLREIGTKIEKLLQSNGAAYSQDQLAIRHAYLFAADKPRRKISQFPSRQMAERALRYAAARGHEKAFNNLLECGVRARASGAEGVQALHQIAGAAYPDSMKRRMIKKLVAHGVDIKATDASNYNAYDHALTGMADSSKRFLRWLRSQVFADGGPKAKGAARRAKRADPKPVATTAFLMGGLGEGEEREPASPSFH